MKKLIKAVANKIFVKEEKEVYVVMPRRKTIDEIERDFEIAHNQRLASVQYAERVRRGEKFYG